MKSESKMKLSVMEVQILEIQIDVRIDIWELYSAGNARKKLKLQLIQDYQQRFEERCEDQSHKKVKTRTPPGQSQSILGHFL